MKLKEEYGRIETPRLQPLIVLLKTKEIKMVDGFGEVQSNKELALELNYSVAKCNSMLRQLQQELIDDMNFNSPLKITKIIHKVIIMLHFDEWKKARDNPKLNTESFFIQLELKETPRIGEFIDFDFEVGNRFYRGIVNDVIHKIQGKTQLIEIHAHPWDNDYARWIRLKNKYHYW